MPLRGQPRPPLAHVTPSAETRVSCARGRPERFAASASAASMTAAGAPMATALPVPVTGTAGTAQAERKMATTRRDLIMATIIWLAARDGARAQPALLLVAAGHLALDTLDVEVDAAQEGVVGCLVL